MNKPILLDQAAFMRRYEREQKDAKWASDIRSYEFWKQHSAKYPDSKAASERVAYYEEKYPFLKKAS